MNGKLKRTSVIAVAVMIVLLTVCAVLPVTVFADTGDGMSDSEAQAWEEATGSFAVITSPIGYRFSLVSKSGGSVRAKADIMIGNPGTVYGDLKSKLEVSMSGSLYSSVLSNWKTYAQVDAICNFNNDSRFNSSPTSVLSSDLDSSWLSGKRETDNAYKLADYLGGSLEGNYIFVEPLYDVQFQGKHHALTCAQMPNLMLKFYENYGFAPNEAINLACYVGWANYLAHPDTSRPTGYNGNTIDFILGAITVTFPRSYYASGTYFNRSGTVPYPTDGINSAQTVYNSMGGVGVYDPDDDDTGSKEIKITVKVDGSEFIGAALTPQLYVDGSQKTLKKTGGVYTYTCAGTDNNYEVRALEVQGGTTYSVFQSSRAIGDTNEVTINYYTIAGGLNDSGISSVTVSAGGKSGSTD